MAKFIHLHVRGSNDSVWVNAEQIVTFKSMHKYGNPWRFTIIDMVKGRLEVTEDDVDINKQLNK